MADFNPNEAGTYVEIVEITNPQIVEVYKATDGATAELLEVIEVEASSRVCEVVEACKQGPPAVFDSIDHSLLNNLDGADQHPITSIINLSATLANLYATKAETSALAGKADKVIPGAANRLAQLDLSTGNLVDSGFTPGDFVTEAELFNHIENTSLHLVGDPRDAIDNANSPAAGNPFATMAAITYEALNANSDVGTGAAQVARGDHTHVKANITDFSEGDYATAAQGSLADTAVQPGSNITVLVNNAGYISDYLVTEGDVLAHIAAINSSLNHDSLPGFLADEHIDWSAAGAKSIYSTRIPQAGVIQHQGALTLTKSQISDFAHTHVKADISDFSEGDYATAAQGALADSALQSGDSISLLNNNVGYVTSLSFPQLTDTPSSYLGHNSKYVRVNSAGNALEFVDGSSDHTHNAASIVSGTFADARISQSSVTQHEGAFDHDALNNFLAAEHVDWAVTGPELLHVDRFPDNLTLDFLAFDLTAAETVSTGQLAWNADEETLDLGISANVTLQLGQEIHYNVRNNTGSPIADGTPVMATGTIGNSGRITIAPADATGTYEPELFLGLTTEAIADGADGKVTHFGKIRGISTDGSAVGESWADGTLLYVDPDTVGTLTSTEPIGNDWKVPIAIVIHAHASNGTLLVRHIGITGLHEAHDASFANEANNDLITWDATGGYWKNVTQVVDSNVPQSAVTQHQAALSITESQISDLGTYIPSSEKGAANGVATLGADSKIPNAQLPALAITSTYIAANETAQLALTVQEGDVCVRTDENKSYIALNSDNVDMGDWQELLTPTAAVTSVDGRTGVVTLSDLYSGISHDHSGVYLELAGGTMAGTIDMAGNPVDNASYIVLGNSALEASVGVVRMQNDTALGWRNAANTADLFLKVDTNDLLHFSGAEGLLTGKYTAEATVPAFVWNETDATADNKKWHWRAVSEELILQALTDAGAGGGRTVAFSRSGNDLSTFELRNSGVAWLTGDMANQNLILGSNTPTLTFDDANTAATYKKTTVRRFDNYLSIGFFNDAETVFKQGLNIWVDEDGTDKFDFYHDPGTGEELIFRLSNVNQSYRTFYNIAPTGETGYLILEADDAETSVIRFDNASGVRGQFFMNDTVDPYGQWEIKASDRSSLAAYMRIYENGRIAFYTEGQSGQSAYEMLRMEDGKLTVMTTDYENDVDADDVIPNKKYVDDAITSGALQDLIEDTSPQLGADLDVNDFDIVGKPAATTTSNGGQIDIISAAGGSASGDGGDVNITASGSVGGDGGDIVVTTGTSTAGRAGNLDVVGGDGSTSGGSIDIVGGDGGTSGGFIKLRPGYDSTDQSADGYILFDSPWGTNSTAAVTRWREKNTNGANYIAFKAPESVTANRTWVLPADDPAVAAGFALSTDASGNLSFVPMQAVENGFYNRTDSTISFTDGTLTFQIAPAVSSFSFVSDGNVYTKTGAETSVITDTEGMWFFYYDGNGTLQKTQTFSNDIITKYAFIALIYWDATNNLHLTLAEERHGTTMDSATHLYNHETIGTRYGQGCQPADVTIGNGSLDAHAQISVGSGEIWDEDLLITLGAKSAPASIPFFYRSGANGDWRKIASTGYVVTTTGTGRAAYNEWTGATWQLTEVGNNDFMLMHLYATNDIDEPYFWFIGQDTYSTLSAAQNAAPTELLNLAVDGMPTVEYKSVATFIVKTADSYANTVKSRIEQTDAGADYEDWRFVDVGAVLNVSGALSQALDDLSDVDVTTTSPVQGHILHYDGAQWSNSLVLPANYVFEHPSSPTILRLDSVGATDNVSLEYYQNDVQRTRMWWDDAGDAFKITVLDDAGAFATSIELQMANDTFYTAARMHVDGTGTLDLSTEGILTLGPTTGENLALDANDVQARNNGAAATLYLNRNGGDVTYGPSTYNVSHTFRGRVSIDNYTEKSATASISTGAVTFEFGNTSSGSNNFELTLSENVTSITLSNPAGSGRVVPVTILIKQDATGSRTVAGWPASVKWPGGTAPVITAAANSVDVISGFTVDGGTTWYLERVMTDMQ